ncbi:MAG: ABC transporter permease [Bacteroidales bacterium]|jgi:peptide/nickel transport system permease protein|nr:ABC transporter permease [Bacteroidales bacterium]
MAWRKFRRNPVSLGSLVFIGISALVAILGYLVTPDSTPFANHQHLEISTHKPGHMALMLNVRKNAPPVRSTFLKKMIRGKPSEWNTLPIQRYWFEGGWLHYETYGGQADYPGLEDRIWLPDVLFAIAHEQEQAEAVNDSLTFIALSGERLSLSVQEMHHQAEEEHIRTRRFYLGTDRFGRDLLSQLVIGTRVSLSVGFIAVFISLVIGITLGSLAGYFRGKFDDLVMWLINVIWSIPTLLLVIAITFAIGKGFWQVFLAVGLTMWVDVARVARGQVLSLREKEFVEAGRVLGLGSGRIILHHILPNIMGPVIVISAANFASAILIEAGLSFLGIGVQPPMPSWGTMIREHYGYIILDKGYLAFLPGLLIMLMVLAFMLTGNGLREALDKTPQY